MECANFVSKLERSQIAVVTVVALLPVCFYRRFDGRIACATTFKCVQLSLYCMKRRPSSAGCLGFFRYWPGLDIATRMGTEVVYCPRTSIRKKGILGSSISLRCSDLMWDGKHLLGVKCEQSHHDRSQWEHGG